MLYQVNLDPILDVCSNNAEKESSLSITKEELILFENFTRLLIIENSPHYQIYS